MDSPNKRFRRVAVATPKEMSDVCRKCKHVGMGAVTPTASWSTCVQTSAPSTKTDSKLKQF
jgi:hypothetical protein